MHEHAWVTVISGEVEVTSGGHTTTGGPGLLINFAPGEIHAVCARETTRLLLILTPWPGDGHPGTMALTDKQTVRQRAAEYRRDR